MHDGGGQKVTVSETLTPPAGCRPSSCKNSRYGLSVASILACRLTLHALAVSQVRTVLFQARHSRAGPPHCRGRRGGGQRPVSYSALKAPTSAASASPGWGVACARRSLGARAAATGSFVERDERTNGEVAGDGDAGAHRDWAGCKCTVLTALWDEISRGALYVEGGCGHRPTEAWAVPEDRGSGKSGLLPALGAAGDPVGSPPALENAASPGSYGRLPTSTLLAPLATVTLFWLSDKATTDQ